jgi:hypothetical protein
MHVTEKSEPHARLNNAALVRKRACVARPRSSAMNFRTIESSRISRCPV